ncbi:MAG: helix-turn-helix transcriptional regulator [Candidatus Thorarchaeota archaeon]
MSKRLGGNWIDIVLVIITVVTLSIAIWIWIVAMPVSREVVVLATTIALIISLVLVLNIAILALVRLQRRVSHLEGALSTRTEPPIDPQPAEVIVVTLTNTERRIINRLEDNGGLMAQDELRRATGLSKSTLSVTLSGLERKSLISRQSSGRTKIVNLERKIPR